MAPTDSRTRQLLGILAKENSKTGQYQRAPSQFRETALDTHKTMPAHDFGPSPDLLPPNFKGPPDYLTMLKTQTARARMPRSASASRRRSGLTDVPADQIEYRSVFKPRPEQEHVCGLATAHRHHVYNSEYALIDTLEVQMYNNERDQKQRMRGAVAAQQRAQLDGQVREKQFLEQQALEARLRDEEWNRRENEAAQEAEKRKLEAQRAKNVALRRDRLDMLQTARETRHQANVTRTQEEARILSELQAQLDQEKLAAAAKMEALKQQSLVTKAENEARIRAKKEADDAQKRLDEEMMQAAIRLAEKQEKDREDSLAAFKSMIDARAKGAGQKKVDDDRERLERETRLIKQFEQQKEHEAQLREEREQQKRDRQKQEVLQARREFLALKEQRGAQAREETAALREEAEARSRAERESEERKLADIRARAKSNGEFLATQITAKEQSAIDDMVGMSARERQMNHRLLKQAVKIVGPHATQMTAKW